MINETAVLVLGYLLPLSAVWAGVLWVRPAIARARVEREALVIRDRLVDGLMSGDIAPNNPRARDAVSFCEFLADHPQEVSMFTAQATYRALRKAGVDVAAQAEARSQHAKKLSVGLATEGGERRLQECERELDYVVARYLVRGSAMWWFLVPLQKLRRYVVIRRKTSVPSLTTGIFSEPPPLPGELAKDLRESSRGGVAPRREWTAQGFFANGSSKPVIAA